jgi:hypothetical protein
MILTADLHLTDAPQDEYRWAIFDHLLRLAKEETDSEIVILGDITDRKDRHSSILVNRLMMALRKLLDAGNSVTILMGNHDKPLAGTPFWQFLDLLESRKLRFITKPLSYGGDLYLPYAGNPAEEWNGIKLSGHTTIFMHQTVTGALGNNGIRLENNKMVEFPRGAKVYSGDIHTPQVVGRVTYVGAPHHVAFGDDYECRILVLDAKANIRRVVQLSPPAKRMLRVGSIAELERRPVCKGDQARVIYKLTLNDIDRWPAIQDQITMWAEEHGIILASVEPDIEGLVRDQDADAELPDFDIDPESVLKMFAEAEGIDASMLDVGLIFLREGVG